MSGVSEKTRQTLENCVNQKTPIQNKSLNTDLPHTCLVKGTAFTNQFGAGAGGFSWTLENYTPASLDWVVQHNWSSLKLSALPQTAKTHDSAGNEYSNPGLPRDGKQPL